MKTYPCVCGQLLFFENVICVQCQREIGFLPDRMVLSSLDPAEGGLATATAPEAKGARYRKCQNYATHQVCNWLVQETSAEAFCLSCRLNETIPNLTVPENLRLWGLIEAAKRRLVYSLLNFDLPIANRQDDPEHGLAFRFLADEPGEMVLTGHDAGLITLNIAEADDAERERRRLNMHEPYRTLLGHFRHEIGHYYWDILIDGTPQQAPFRQVFGDESLDYGEALKTYYAKGIPADWQARHISAYATAHAWEDWAETWAHYMHIQDTLEVAVDFGFLSERLKLDPTAQTKSFWQAPKQKQFERVLTAWRELSIALNSFNRSMGLPDLYPFVLSETVGAKLEFISRAIGERVVTGSKKDVPPLTVQTQRQSLSS